MRIPLPPPPAEAFSITPAKARDYVRIVRDWLGTNPRTGEALDRLLARRRPDGRWTLDLRHRNTLHEDMAGDVGAPNRWITLRALRCLGWASATKESA